MNKTYKLISALVLCVMVFGALFAFGDTACARGGDTESHVNSDKGRSNDVYIVQMIESPAVAYDGNVPGMKATRPAKGKKIDPDSTDVVRYAAYLDAQHDRALREAGGGRNVYHYHYSYNGFAAELSEVQAEKMKKVPGVVSVSKDELNFADTSSTPAFLDLNTPGGLWDQLGGAGRAGEDIIIGIVDSGIWPESLSFTDRTGTGPNGQPGKLAYRQIPGWHGKCTPGEDFVASMCNQKLIGARYFNHAWGGNAGIDAQRPWEFNSPRDYNGHGTHTASTAGGNYGVQATGPAAVFGTVSGMAPRARIAAYKALWSTQDASTASGFTSDLVAAIDQAVADGVDVISYSISGSITNFLEPVQVSFLFAADAGVFVAASAGNSGPTASTVAHPSPWLTTVAAGTHNRAGEGSVTLGNDDIYDGASLATPAGPAPLVYSANVGLAGEKPEEVRLCYPGTLDSAKVTGKIVLCDRGTIARMDKSYAVQQAGGAGMILANPGESSLNADLHFVPTVHVSHVDRALILDYINTQGADATATIHQSSIKDTPAPFIASFSSRGPSLASGDQLKPDITAPGVDILAAVAPPGNHELNFNIYSGTSMSAPHIAGIAALLSQAHPDWSPAMIKSAMMTSAYDLLGSDGDPFTQGAGHVRPGSAVDPGLVYNSGWIDWLGFLCGTSQLTCPSISIDPSDLNLPSIAIGDLTGVQTVTRKVTNVGSEAETYTASHTGLGGIEVNVEPESEPFTINPGETKSYTVTFTQDSADLNEYTEGYLTWTGDNGHTVRIPVVLRPVALAAPAEVSGNGDPLSYDVVFGYNGDFTATPRGMVAALTFDETVEDDPTDSFTPGGPGTVSFDVDVPDGTSYARFSLFDASVSPASDLDLYVFQGSDLVGASGGGTSEEEVDLVDPAADTYTVWVHGWGVPGTAEFTLFTWVLGTADADNMDVSAPAMATPGDTGTIGLTFSGSGLDPATKYLGSIAYSGANGMPDPTIVRVDT
jgi:hypothetical protein